MKELPYGITVDVRLSYDDAIAAVRDALKEEGFGILTEIDVKKTLKEKVGADLQPYVILGACNPALAYTALKDDMDLGLLLPCNVTVREVGAGSVVGILDPLVMSKMSDAPGLDQVARIARQHLERVVRKLESVAGGASAKR